MSILKRIAIVEACDPSVTTVLSRLMKHKGVDELIPDEAMLSKKRVLYAFAAFFKNTEVPSCIRRALHKEHSIELEFPLPDDIELLYQSSMREFITLTLNNVENELRTEHQELLVSWKEDPSIRSLVSGFLNGRMEEPFYSPPDGMTESMVLELLGDEFIEQDMALLKAVLQIPQDKLLQFYFVNGSEELTFTPLLHEAICHCTLEMQARRFDKIPNHEQLFAFGAASLNAAAACFAKQNRDFISVVEDIRCKSEAFGLQVQMGVLSMLEETCREANKKKISIDSIKAVIKDEKFKAKIEEVGESSHPQKSAEPEFAIESI